MQRHDAACTTPAPASLLTPTPSNPNSNPNQLKAGTLSGNPLAMVAGIKTLEILSRPGAYEHLDKVTKRLVAGLLAAAKETGHGE